MFTTMSKIKYQLGIIVCSLLGIFWSQGAGGCLCGFGEVDIFSADTALVYKTVTFTLQIRISI